MQRRAHLRSPERALSIVAGDFNFTAEDGDRGNLSALALQEQQHYSERRRFEAIARCFGLFELGQP